MDKNTILAILEILRLGREYCVDLLLSDVYIHQAFFKYRKSPEIMTLVIDRYKTDCLNHYMELTKGKECDIRNYVANIVTSLIDDGIGSNNSDLCHHLLKSKKETINYMITKSDEMEKRFKELLVAIEKDKALYEDEIERLEKIDNIQANIKT